MERPYSHDRPTSYKNQYKQPPAHEGVVPTRLPAHHPRNIFNSVVSTFPSVNQKATDTALRATYTAAVISFHG